MNKMLLFFGILAGIVAIKRVVLFLAKQPALDIFAWSFVGVSVFGLFKLYNYVRSPANG